MGFVGSLEHAYRQFGFGLEGEGVGDVSSLASGQVSAPVLGDIQFAIKESMALLSHVGEEDADLTVLDGAADTAILRRDASRMAATFGEAALINGENGKDRRGRSARRVQGLADQVAQEIAHAIFVPDRMRKQALDPVRAGEPGLFSNLPAILAGNVAHEGLQVEQGVLVNFGSGKQGCQTVMQEIQARDPGTDQMQRGSQRLGCGMLKGLHAFLLSQKTARWISVACHIGGSMAEGVLFRGNFPGICPRFNPIGDAQRERGNIPWKISQIQSATVVL